MKMRFLEIIAVATLCFGAGVLSAHHSTDVTFDLDNLKILKGVISSVRWTNPHTYLFMDVTTCKVDNYAVEMGSPSAMYRSGLSRDILLPGMPVSILSAPAKRNYTTSIPEVMDRAKLQHFVLGGCLTRTSGERLDYGEALRCPNPPTTPRPVPEEGVFLR
jgi:Family of unknown function (DUF6152)